MKTIMIAMLAVSFLAAPAAFASREHCVTRVIVANYKNGSMTSTQCFSHESNYVSPTKSCELKRS